MIILYYTLNVNISYLDFFGCKGEKGVEDFAFFNAFSNGYVDLFSLILCF